MSKGARLREARDKQPVRADESVLNEAVIAVGDMFGTEARCVEAAAVLQHAAKLLGWTLTARPVSVIAIDSRTGDTAIMGPKASELVPEDERPTFVDLTPTGQVNNGHVVLTSEDPLRLYDPNMRQLGAHGFPTMSIVVRIKSAHPASGRWEFEQEPLRILYLVDDDNRALLTNYAQVYRRHERDAANLVRLLRSGATADEIARSAGLR